VSPEIFKGFDLPESYQVNSTKEKLALSYAENFRKQFVHLYRDRKPLLLNPVNELLVEARYTTLSGAFFDPALVFSARQHIAYMLSALYAIARPSVSPVVCPSVRRVYHIKTVEVRMMKFSPHGSPIHLVFAG